MSALSSLARATTPWLAAMAILACFPRDACCAGDSDTAAERLAQLRQQRKKAVHRTRRIIFNNDGNEPVYYCKEATPDALLACRTTALAGTQVDSIFYCTWSSGLP